MKLFSVSGAMFSMMSPSRSALRRAIYPVWKAPQVSFVVKYSSWCLPLDVAIYPRFSSLASVWHSAAFSGWTVDTWLCFFQYYGYRRIPLSEQTISYNRDFRFLIRLESVRY